MLKPKFTYETYRKHNEHFVCSINLLLPDDGEGNLHPYFATGHQLMDKELNEEWGWPYKEKGYRHNDDLIYADSLEALEEKRLAFVEKCKAILALPPINGLPGYWEEEFEIIRSSHEDL